MMQTKHRWTSGETIDMLETYYLENIAKSTFGIIWDL